MTATEARYFLETCNEQIEAGMTAALRRRILHANEIVAADRKAKLEAQAAAFRAALAAKRVA